jgi:hypothetical protein
MDGYRFEQVCKALTLEMGQGRRPVPSQYIAVYHRLKAEQGWDRVDKAKVSKCPTCEGVGMVYTWMMRERDSFKDKFARPCPQCAPIHPSNAKPQLEGWIHVDQQAEDLDALYLKLGPKGAAFGLPFLDQSPIGLKPETLATLMQRAQEPLPDKGGKSLEAFLADTLQTADPLPQPKSLGDLLSGAMP